MNEPTILPLLKTIPIFQELNDAQHKEIIKNIVLQYYPASYTLFKEGDAGDSMYIIKSGLARIVQGENELTTLSANDFFGEMALISDEPRNATAVTASECELFVLKKSDFFKLVEKTPGLANRVSTEFIKRVKKNTKPSIHPEL